MARQGFCDLLNKNYFYHRGHHVFGNVTHREVPSYTVCRNEVKGDWHNIITLTASNIFLLNWMTEKYFYQAVSPNCEMISYQSDSRKRLLVLDTSWTKGFLLKYSLRLVSRGWGVSQWRSRSSDECVWLFLSRAKANCDAGYTIRYLLSVLRW